MTSLGIHDVVRVESETKEYLDGNKYNNKSYASTVLRFHTKCQYTETEGEVEVTFFHKLGLDLSEALKGA